MGKDSLEIISVRKNKRYLIKEPHKNRGITFVGMLHKPQLQHGVSLHLYMRKKKFLRRKITFQKFCFRKVMPETCRLHALG